MFQISIICWSADVKSGAERLCLVRKLVIASSKYSSDRDILQEEKKYLFLNRTIIIFYQKSHLGLEFILDIGRTFKIISNGTESIDDAQSLLRVVCKLSWNCIFVSYLLIFIISQRFANVARKSPRLKPSWYLICEIF